MPRAHTLARRWMVRGRRRVQGGYRCSVVESRPIGRWISRDSDSGRELPGSVYSAEVSDTQGLDEGREGGGGDCGEGSEFWFRFWLAPGPWSLAPVCLCTPDLRHGNGGVREGRLGRGGRVPGTPTTGLRQRGNGTTKGTPPQRLTEPEAPRRSPRRDERVTVRGPATARSTAALRAPQPMDTPQVEGGVMAVRGPRNRRPSHGGAALGPGQHQRPRSAPATAAGDSGSRARRWRASKGSLTRRSQAGCRP